MPEAKEGEFVDCAYCGGRGRELSSPCSVCEGVGKFVVPDNKKWVRCSYCDGRGRNLSSPCPVCKGVGAVW